MVSWSITNLKHRVEIYNLRITDEQAREILRNGLIYGEQKSFSVKYGLFSNNCATNVLDIIDAVIKPETAKYPIYFNLIYPIERALPSSGPLGTFQILQSRNLIGVNSGRSMVD